MPRRLVLPDSEDAVKLLVRVVKVSRDRYTKRDMRRSCSIRGRSWLLRSSDYMSEMLKRRDLVLLARGN